ncbi:hypothetical protein, partial [Acetobacterium sp. K1/6]|uniref:hypothetical protein n=1 Tax=Acetobacterium sp. K1/6 TaxID=3055467 RepID=UPI002ACAF360
IVHGINVCATGIQLNIVGIITVKYSPNRKFVPMLPEFRFNHSGLVPIVQIHHYSLSIHEAFCSIKDASHRFAALSLTEQNASCFK